MNEFLEYLLQFRLVAIEGRLGAGKTAMAVTIAEWLLEKQIVRGVVTNFPTIFPSFVGGRDDGTLVNRVIIYDEAWQNLDARSWASNDTDTYGAFSRKFGVIWLMPSVIPIDKRLRALVCTPMFRNPLTGTVTWAFATSGTKPIGGKFTINSKGAWGKYATSYVPARENPDAVSEIGRMRGDCGIKKRYENTYALWRDDDEEEFVEIRRDRRALAPEEAYNL